MVSDLIDFSDLQPSPTPALSTRVSLGRMVKQKI